MQRTFGPEERPNNPLHQIYAEPRASWDREGAILHFPFRCVVHHLEMLRRAIGVKFLDNEVRYAGVNLESRRRRNWTSANVRLNCHAVGFRHRCDLLEFHNAAGVTDVWLENVGGTRFEYRSEAVARVDPFAKRDWDLDMVRNLFQGRAVKRIRGFFDEENVQFLQLVAKPDRFTSCQSTTEINHDVDIGSDRMAYRLHFVQGEACEFAIDCASGNVPNAAVFVWRGQWIAL